MLPAYMPTHTLVCPPGPSEIARNAAQSGRTNSENAQRQHVSPSPGSGGGGNGNRIFAFIPGVGSRGGALGRSVAGVMSVPAALGTDVTQLQGNTVAMGRQGGQTADTDRPYDQLARARVTHTYTHAERERVSCHHMPLILMCWLHWLASAVLAGGGVHSGQPEGAARGAAAVRANDGARKVRWCLCTTR